MYPKVELNPARRKQFHGHKHPWIFSGAIIKTEKKPEELNGQIVSVFLEKEFILHGYFNSQSQIAIRALSWSNEEKIDQEFFIKKISQALNLRKKYILSAKTTACRLIFAESDFLPGFIVDKYNHTLIVQIHTLGAEKLKEVFTAALIESYKDVFGQKPVSIIEKSDIASRVQEGLAKENFEVLYGKEVTSETIKENDHQYIVDFKGQKTGFFLDQRENRQALSQYCKNRKVLNLFSYTGGFSIYTASSGAQLVDSVDISKPASDLASRNFKLNKLTQEHQEITADVFVFLETLEAEKYDLIIVDPPAFIKSKKNIQDGIKGYITVNSMALRKLPENGLLVSSSCSAALSDEDFMRMLNWSAEAAGCQLQILEKRSQPADHPLTPYFPEGNYLKFVICKKVKI